MLKHIAPLVRGYKLRKLLNDTSGVAFVEFALAAPLMLSVACYGVELAYFTSVDMRMSEVALSLADNASRIGQNDNVNITPTVNETDIKEIMRGAQEQSAGFNFQAQGKIILSSLERDTATGKQVIRWQRCYGNLARQSGYGNDTDRNGLNGDVITGLGSGPVKITANANSAVMFVEVFYTYKGLFGDLFLSDRTLKKEGAFLVRDNRRLGVDVSGGGGTHSCATPT
ncbi:TadE/TadG family type IV pilus assembly protein [Novosphingobium sp.]|jgi:hypothetical protein|uniref:TadE/TadG family type IV pilus assembly protein n=1 Tax=Novosphingobium sp. TaxID=1874826 RepID=UPI003563525B